MDKLIKANKISSGIIVVLVLVLGAVYFSARSLETENQDLKKASIVSDMDLQTKCAAQAKIFFEYFVSDPQERQTDEYSNYYNSKLDKCFVLVKHGFTATDGAFGIYTKNFFDAIEKKQYGSYGWQPDKVKKYWEVPPFDCSMYPDGNQDAVKTCSSEGEFDAFVGTYMEN